MAAIPYADLSGPDIQPLAARIAAERGSVLHLYQMLLHAPPVAEGWLTYLTAIRQKSTLPGALREMVIMRVAWLNGASYEAHQHAPIALKEGMTQAQLDALPAWRDSTQFGDEARAVLAYTDAMTRDIQVDRAAFEEVSRRFSHRHIVELTATIAAYNMVSRFLEAMRIHADETK